jgi:membrane protein required for colicin V production
MVMFENASTEWLLFLPLLYGLVRGWMRGLIREVIGLIALVVALAASLLFHEQLYLLFRQYTSEEGALVHVAAYVTIFLGVLIVLNLIGKMLTRLVESAQLGTINRLLGALFSGLKWAIICALLVQIAFVINERFEWFDANKALGNYPLLHFFQNAGEWLTQGLSGFWEKRPAP